MGFHYLKQNITTPKFFSGLLLALLLLQPFSVFAIVYQPGETLNPACAPTDADCGVAAPITASSTSALSLGGAAPEGSLFYVAGTSTLQNIIPAGNLQYSIGSPESRLQNVYTNNLILGSASFVMEDVGGVLRFRGVNSVIPGLVIDPSSGATINGNIFINGGATFTNATTTGSHSVGGALVLGGESFQNLVGVGLKIASSTLALDNSGDWTGTFDGQEASYFLANSFSTSSANSWLGGKTTGNLTEGPNLYWTTERGNQNFTSNFSATTTDALTEGAVNKYYTDTRFDNRFILKTTNDLTEGLNLYYTDARARNALSATAPLSYASSTGVFSFATGNITAPSNPEITIGGGTGAILGSGVTIAIPEAGVTTRGFVSTTTQTFAGDKTFSGNTALSGALNVAGASTFTTSSVNSLTVFGISTLAGITGTSLNISGNTSLATTTATSLMLSPMTQGSLLFAGAGGLVSQNNANLFWDNTNSRLGIGLLNPADTLNVYGGIKTESTVGTIMAAGSDGAFAYNFGSGVSNSLSKRVAQSSDDAEQNLTTNGVNLTSSDLELINDTGVNQEVGMRFQNITIPQGATITNAYIEFTVDGAHSGTTNLNFYGEAADNAAVFAAVTNNITGRAKTSAAVTWSNVPAWTTIGQAQQTPNLTSIIQEIVNRAGWLSGNSLVIIVNGTTGSLRRAVSYDGGASSAALLVVQYTTSSTNVSYAINNLGPGLFRINDEFNDVSPFVVDSSGNVGIGTSTPSQKLHVSGGNIKLDWDKALVWRNAVDSADTEVIRVTGINPNQNSLNFTIPGGPAADPSNARFVISADGSFYFRNNTPADTMRLTSAGSLGIGTASPGARLDVRNNDIAQLYLTNTLSGTQAHIGVGDVGTWGANNLVFSDVSNNPRFVVDLLNGNVGIGESNPGAKLHVIGISNTAGFLFNTSDIGAAAVPFKIAGTDVGAASTVLSSTVLTNNTTGGNQNVMLIENAAGSGVTDALLKLNNADTDTAVADGLLITSANGFITDAIDISGTNITNAINIGGNKIVGDSLSINGNGSVGIGTVSPSSALHIVGSEIVNSQASAVGAGATQRGLQIISGSLGANDGTIRGIDVSATVAGTTNIGDELTGLRVEAGAIDTNGTTRGLHVVQPSTVGAFGSVVADLVTLERQGGTLTNALQYVDAGATKFAITAAGNVGIGTSTPDATLRVWGSARIGSISGANPAYEFYVINGGAGPVARFQDADGFCDINPTNASLSCASDISLKKNILTLDSSLEKTLALNPVTFNWRSEEDGAATHLGFIAQEVEQLFPALVFTDESGLKSLSYANFAPILVKAMQEIVSLADSFKQSLVAWFSDAANGIGDFFANRVRTKEFCIGDDTGGETCITKQQLDELLIKTTQTQTASVTDITAVELPQQITKTAPMEIAPTELDLAEFSSAETATTEIVTEPLQTEIESLEDELLSESQPAM